MRDLSMSRRLAAADLDGGESDGEDWDENQGADGSEKRPVLELREAVGEDEEAEEVGDEDEAGGAFELRVGAGERNLAEICDEDFAEEDCGGDEDGGVDCGVLPAEEMECDGEGGGGEPGECEGVQDAARDGARVLGVAVDPEFEDPAGAEIGGHFEGEADAGEEAEGEDEGDGEEFGRRERLGNDGVETLRSVEGFGGGDQAECGEGEEDLEVGFASTESGDGEAKAGALRGRAEKEVLERREERERQAR